MIALPEMFYYPYELSAMRGLAEDKNRILDRFKTICLQNKIHLCTGSIVEKEDNKYYNTAFLIDPSGNELLKYRKCRLFDVKFKGLNVQESSVFTAGSEVETAVTDLGNIAVIICYDIRFPEISRAAAAAGAEILIVPADFNQISGPAHWEVMMRARAIENQVYLAAVSQAKNIDSSYKVYGHSIIISPWGEILSEAGEGEEIITADLDCAFLEDVRKRLPLLKHIGKSYNTLSNFSACPYR